MGQQKVLLILAHPRFEHSRINRSLIANAARLKEVTIDDLYENYPDFNIDVAAEQERLMQHEAVVFQHPLYWYSVPPLLKQWMDLVLQYQWAYGNTSPALRGKIWSQVISIGGSEADYKKDGRHGFSMDTFLSPFIQTASLCKMQFIQPCLLFRSSLVGEEALQNATITYLKFLENIHEAALANPAQNLPNQETLLR